MEDARPYARMKLMVVGIQGIGKTSLLEQLRQDGSNNRKKTTDVSYQNNFLHIKLLFTKL